MWDGNVFVPIGISAGQIIFAGTFDASDPAGTGKLQALRLKVQRQALRLAVQYPHQPRQQ
jgi:hypothetical protein